MNLSLNELYRLICNIVRIGTVVSVDHEKCLARVSTGGNETGWIPWSVLRAGEAVTWWAPTEGEQVFLFAVGGELETAMIGGSLYTAGTTPESHGELSCTTTHPDGAAISYDPKTGALSAVGVKSATIEASESITADAPKITCTASSSITFDSPEVICTKKLSCATLELKQGGEMKGNIAHSGGTFTSNGVQVDDHAHGGVQRGGSMTEGTQ